MINQLISDYKACEEIIKKASKTFYKAFSMLKDENKRNAIYAVYAYCRYADDIIDENNDLNALTNLRGELDQFVNHHVANNFIFRALLDVRMKYYQDYDFKAFYDMLDGQYMDTNFIQPQSIDELYVYCQKVASSVGEMLTPILSPHGNKERLALVSYHLGIGMQLTNILRDIGEDFDKGRIYLPKEVMSKYAYTETDLKNKIINQNFKDMYDELANLAFKHYEIAYNNLDEFPKDSRFPLTLALVLYREITYVCIENDYDVLTKRNKVSDLRKLKLIGEIKKNE